MPTYSFWAQTTSATAEASTLVVGNTAPIQITFTTDSPFIAGVDDTGDLTFESTLGAPDPDTWVTVNGTTYSFTYDVVGVLPTGHNKVPDPIEGKNVAVITLSNGDKYFYVMDGSGTEAFMADMGGGNIRLDAPNENPDPVYVCFCTGTLIATPSGPRRVETLVAGDMVLNDRGDACQIIWAGSSRVSRNQLRRNASLAPIRIPAHAFGPALPNADLYVSPQHRVVLEGAEAELLFGEPRVLAAAKHLVGTYAEAVSPDTDVEYFHILTEGHEILVSNGLATESFQPARRTIDVMSPDRRAVLEQTLSVLEREDILLRQDALLSLKRDEVQVLAAMMQRRQATFPQAASDSSLLVA